MQDLKLDIYRPKPALDELTKKPAIFFVHGGGLVGGSKDSQGAVDLGYLYAQLGYVYISIDYRIGWNNGEAEDGCGGDTIDLFRATCSSKYFDKNTSPLSSSIIMFAIFSNRPWGLCAEPCKALTAKYGWWITILPTTLCAWYANDFRK